MASQTRGRRDRRDTEMGLCNCVAAVFQVLLALESITFISGQGKKFALKNAFVCNCYIVIVIVLDYIWNYGIGLCPD